MPDDVASGAYTFLSGLPDVQSVVGAFPADDPDNPGVLWIFVRQLYTRMEAMSIVKGTHAVALVLAYAGQSATPLEYSTVQGQRLEVDIWVDPLRDLNGNIASPSETEGRGKRVFDILDSHLHRAAADPTSQQWGDLVTTGSTRMAGPTWYPVPDGDGLIRGAAFYNVMTYGNWDPVVQVGGGDSGSGG